MKRAFILMAMAWVLAGTIGALALAAQQQAGSIQVTILNNGQPIGDLELVLELANRNKVSIGATDTSGNVNVALDLANMGKVQVDVVVEEECPDNKTHVTILPHGQQPDQKGCKKRRRIIVIWWKSGQHVTIDVGKGAATVTQTGAGPAAPPHTPLITYQLGGGVGLKHFSSANTCQSIVVVLPSAKCSSGQQSFAFNLDGTLKITRYFGIGSGYARANAIARNATASIGASTFDEHSTFQPQFEPLVAQVFLPIKRAELFAEGGFAFWQINMKETQATTAGGTTNTVDTSLRASGHGPAMGGGIRVMISRHVGIQGHYQYFRAQQNQVLNEHNNVVLFGVFVSLP
jgi:hypothetical protein